MAKFGAGTMMAIIFAILIGLGGAYFVRQILTQDPIEEEVKQKTAMVTVPTVAYDIPQNRTLVKNDIIVQSYTREEAARRFGKFPLYMSLVSQIVGRRAKVPISAGNPVTIGDLYPDGRGPSIEEQLKPGFVAKPLPISANDPMLTYIAPGSIVDVYFTTAKGGVTVSLLERVEVLDVPKIEVPVFRRRRVSLTNQAADANVPTITRVQKVTVMVTDYQAKALTMVEGQGELRLALRKKNDFSTLNPNAAESRMTIGRLLHEPVGLQRKGMQVYQGSKANNIIFNQKLIYDERFNIQTPIPEQPPVPKAKSALGS